MKKVLSIILAMTIFICLVSVHAFASTDTERQLYAKMRDLRNLCEEAHFAYGIGHSITQTPLPGSTYKPKYLACSDTTKAQQAWEEACPMVKGYFDSYMNPYDGEISVETATEKYNKLYEELYKIIIDRSELDKLVAFCEKEKNDDNYYEFELWNDFQAEISQSKELLADGHITDLRVNTAYYELMYQLNLLCTFNQVPGDLDHDGEMTIYDATYIQRYLANYETINLSQLVVTGNYRIEELSITSATSIQRKLAKIINMYEPYVLEILINNLEQSNPESEEFELSSWRNNLIYYDGLPN